MSVIRSIRPDFYEWVPLGFSVPGSVELYRDETGRAVLGLSLFSRIMINVTPDGTDYGHSASEIPDWKG